jgi:ankyrin repeat protein
VLNLAQIMLSAYHGHAPLVKLLLQYGADPNRLNDRGQSPLAGAVFKNEREVIQALLAGNADPRIGEPSALDACRVGHILVRADAMGAEIDVLQIFKQEEFEAAFKEQVEKLDASGEGARNGS